MGRRIKGAIAAGACVLVAIAMLGVEPVEAGGGPNLRPDREFYRPGEVVHMSSDLTKLDRDWFGPYTVLLRSFSGTVPGADEGIPVGRLVVTRLDDTTVRAEVTFVLPKLPDGAWQVDYCSPDCSRPLGDLSSGFLVIGTEPLWGPSVAPPAPAATPAPVTTAPTAPPTTRAATTVAPPTTSVSVSAAATLPAVGDDEVAWWFVALGAAITGAALVAIARIGRGRRRITTATNALPSGGPVGDESGDIRTVTLEPTEPRIGVGR